MALLSHFRRIRKAGLRGWLLALALAGLTSTANANYHDESSLKLNFLRGFVDFVEWPQQRQSLTLCTIGQDALGEAADRLTGQMVRKSALVVRRHLAADAVHQCDLIYVAAGERKHLEHLIALTKDRPVLLVADLEGAAQLGAGLSLHPRAGGFIGFDANLTATQGSGLKMSAKLLRLARRVY